MVRTAVPGELWEVTVLNRWTTLDCFLIACTKLWLNILFIFPNRFNRRWFIVLTWFWFLFLYRMYSWFKHFLLLTWAWQRTSKRMQTNATFIDVLKFNDYEVRQYEIYLKWSYWKMHCPCFNFPEKYPILLILLIQHPAWPYSNI